MVGCRDIFILVSAISCACAGGIIWGVAGGVLGYVVISILVGLLFEVYDVIAEKRTLRRKRARFGPFFGEYYAPEKRDEWARLKRTSCLRG